jgi:quinohemoprotein ethanol dehydrogenase
MGKWTCGTVRFCAVVVVATVLALAGCRGGGTKSTTSATTVNDAALADESNGDDWLGFGRTHSERRFSPLTQINETTVSRLRLDWYLNLPDDRGLVSTPLVVDGVMYFVGSMNRVRAVDAATGAVKWTYDPRVMDQAGDRMRAGWDLSRGIAFWNGKVYVATWDGRLNAIDAATGREVWSTMTVDPAKALYITGAPKVFKGKVLIGNGGTEIGAARGYVTAYDAETGKQAWRFFIVPGNPADGFESPAMEMAAKTWTGEWWKFGGGGNAWHGFTYDAELDQLYIGTGNGSPWNQKIRSPGGGDNLFVSSIVALDPDTGEYRWHYQTTPGESWDFNSNMDILLADLTINGETVKALMQAPKNGFFYVIDRRTGKLLSADPFAEVTWASRVDLATGRPVENPEARYPGGSTTVAPSALGAHNWHAMSYNPGTGLVYIPTIHLAAEFSDAGMDLPGWRSPDWSNDSRHPGTGVAYRAVPARADGVWGTLQAWDPVKKTRSWEVTLPGLWNPGTMTSAGNLVFQGRADGHLVAYQAVTGQELWRFDVGLGISAPPITYAVNGRQYVALLVGWGGSAAALGGQLVAAHGWAYGVHPRRLVAFSLEGKATLPPSPPPVAMTPIGAKDHPVDAAAAARGRTVYAGHCVTCHGRDAVAAGMAPDLRASAVVLSDVAFADIVRGGVRRERGMPRFAAFTDARLADLRHYVRQQAELGLAAMALDHAAGATTR